MSKARFKLSQSTFSSKGLNPWSYVYHSQTPPPLMLHLYGCLPPHIMGQALGEGGFELLTVIHSQVPEKVFVTDKLPKTATGKIQRRHMVDAFITNKAAGGASDAGKPSQPRSRL